MLFQEPCVWCVKNLEIVFIFSEFYTNSMKFNFSKNLYLKSVIFSVLYSKMAIFTVKFKVFV